MHKGEARKAKKMRARMRPLQMSSSSRNNRQCVKALPISRHSNTGDDNINGGPVAAASAIGNRLAAAAIGSIEPASLAARGNKAHLFCVWQRPNK